MSTTHEYPATKTNKAPAEPGIYAWYYKPRGTSVRARRTFPATVSSILETRYESRLSVSLRYGMRLQLEDECKVQINGREAQGIVEECVERGGDHFASFLRDTMSPIFARPLYVGITNNLRRRLYEEHFGKLCAFWEDSKLSTFLSTHPGASVERVQEVFNLGHTFSLDARVRGIPPRDLVVHTYPTQELNEWIDDEDNESNPDRLIEQVIQLMSDPVCGRR